MSMYVTRQCPLCGPRRVVNHGANAEAERRPEYIVCPTCHMAPAEHAYRARILADSAAVYAAEAREFNARRNAERAA